MLIINAEIRKKKGKSKNRKMRKKNELPGILYGNNKKEILIKLNHNQIINKLSKKDFFKNLILNINQEKIKVKIKEIQKHHFKLKIIHIDFIRI